jgi:hypothetical protein
MPQAPVNVASLSVAERQQLETTIREEWRPLAGGRQPRRFSGS